MRSFTADGGADAGAGAGAASAGAGGCCCRGRSYIADEKRAVRGRLSWCPDLNQRGELRRGGHSTPLSTQERLAGISGGAALAALRKASQGMSSQKRHLEIALCCKGDAPKKPPRRQHLPPGADLPLVQRVWAPSFRAAGRQRGPGWPAD